jgi:hypothetical protein
MTETASQLTNDEFTVLGITKEGACIGPIGRWEQPVLSLAAKGLLKKENEFNYSITEAGRAAWQERDSEDDAGLMKLIEANNAVAQSRLSIEQAAQHFATAARASALMTGDTPQQAARKWSEALVKRTLELLDG